MLVVVEESFASCRDAVSRWHPSDIDLFPDAARLDQREFSEQEERGPWGRSNPVGVAASGVEHRRSTTACRCTGDLDEPRLHLERAEMREPGFVPTAQAHRGGVVGLRFC